MSTEHEFFFNRLYVIESLADDESPTHERLLEFLEVEMRRLPDGEGLDVVHQRVTSAGQLVGLLVAIKDRAHSQGERPILHFEVHGDREGLELQPNLETCRWADISNALRNINIATRNGLLITLAVCHGSFLADIVDVTERAPFWALVGSLERFNSMKAEVGFQALYRALLRQGDGAKALAAMREDLPLTPDLYGLFTCVHAYVLTFRQQLGGDIEGRVTRFLRERRVADTTDNRARVRDELVGGGLRRDFVEMQEKFFMLDLRPENREWVRLDFDRDVLGEGAPSVAR